MQSSASAVSYLLARHTKGICTQVTPGCPVNETIYGYRPSLVWNALFLAVFLLSALVHAGQGIYYRRWTFLIAMVVGGVCEAVGEAGRLMMHNNPWNDSGFKLQIVLLTFAPAFLAAGVYLNLRHLVITFGASFSRIKPVSYTRIFISCDIFSIILQGAGGGIASAATNTQKGLLDAGNGLMIAGMVFQVATLLLFGLFAAEYGMRVWKHKNELNPATFTLRRSRMFKSFLGALTLAYVAILIRCVYRVAEMSGGWGNSIMKEETLFTALDSFMVAIAMIVLNLCHPGMVFGARQRSDGKLDEEETGNVQEMK